MTISITRHGDATRIDIGPQLIVANRQELKDTVLDELQHGERQFLIDFGRTGYIDSSGLGVLVSLSKQIRDQRGSIRLLNLNSDLMTLFRLTKLDSLFQFGGDSPLGDTAAGAVAPLKPRPRGPLHGAAEPDLPQPDDGALS
jgi:anti-sigma B factor antagonist